jgi:hypothetical protein
MRRMRRNLQLLNVRSANTIKSMNVKDLSMKLSTKTGRKKEILVMTTMSVVRILPILNGNAKTSWIDNAIVEIWNANNSSSTRLHYGNGKTLISADHVLPNLLSLVFEMTRRKVRQSPMSPSPPPPLIHHGRGLVPFWVLVPPGQVAKGGPKQALASSMMTDLGSELPAGDGQKKVSTNR